MGDSFKNIKNTTITNRSIVNDPNNKKTTVSLDTAQELNAKKFRDYIANNQLAECLDELMLLFEQNQNKEGLKEVVLFKSKLLEIQQKERLQLASAEEIDRMRDGLKQRVLGLVEGIVNN